MGLSSEMNDFIMTGHCPRCAGKIIPTSENPFGLAVFKQDDPELLELDDRGRIIRPEPSADQKILADDFARTFWSAQAERVERRETAERLLKSKPKEVRGVEFLDFMRYWMDSNARGPTGAWMAKPLESYQYNVSKVTRRARRTRDEAERLFHVEVDLTASAKGPMMRCKLCTGDWLVGEWP